MSPLRNSGQTKVGIDPSGNAYSMAWAGIDALAAIQAVGYVKRLTLDWHACKDRADENV